MIHIYLDRYNIAGCFAVTALPQIYEIFTLEKKRQCIFFLSSKTIIFTFYNKIYRGVTSVNQNLNWSYRYILTIQGYLYNSRWYRDHIVDLKMGKNSTTTTIAQFPKLIL